MKRRDEMLLTRHLTGETSPGDERELAARLAREPELAAELERLRALWTGLDLPPTAGAPAGFAARLRRRLAEEQASRAWLGPAPAWARLAAAAALVAGVALGAGLGAIGPGATGRVEVSAETATLSGELAGDSLADAYLDALSTATAASEEASR